MRREKNYMVEKMEDNDREFLLGIVEDCKIGCFRIDDAAWVFIYAITNKNDPSLLLLASDEIKSELFKIVNELNAGKVYKIHVGHSDPIYVKDRNKKA